MIVVESKRKSMETLKRNYPNALILDVTSKAEDEFRRLSPFYPCRGIPVPFSEGVTSACVEGVWQGLKVFEGEDIDRSCFRNDTMKNLKRTVRTHGSCLGHRKGVNGTELLGYIEAREQIYIPTYNWMLENRCQDLVHKLKIISKSRTIVLLDYDTNGDWRDPRKPLSHASLIKAYLENH